MEYYEVMEFGKLLERLLQISGQKNYALAAQLGYDVSYISKWTTKSNLPANKNITVIIEGIAAFLMESLTPLTSDQLCKFFQLEEQAQLYKIIETALLESYEHSLHKQTKELENEQDYTLLNSHFSVNPRLQRMTLNKLMKVNEGKQDMIIFANLLTMGKEDKLSIAGIDQKKELRHQRIRMMISLQRDPANIVFDSLLIIHMLSNYANSNFCLYLTSTVPCSLMLTVKDYYSHTSILVQNHRCISSHTCMQKPLVNELYNTMEEVIHNQAKQALGRITMKEMIQENSYMQSIIAPGMCWLVGTITEQFLPSDLFYELLEQQTLEEAYKEQLKKNYMVMQNAAMVSPIQVLLYESTLGNYILDGKLDFFQIPVTMTMHQRQRHLKYMKDLFSENHYMEIRMIEGDLVENFKKFENPSFYLSHTLSYLRMKTAESYQLYLIRQKEVSDLFFEFFEELWGHREDVVRKDTEAIQKKLEYYLSCFQLFETLE